MNDKNGNGVVVGSRVKVVQLSPKFVNSLPEQERPDVASMVNGIFVVYDIDEHGQAWIERQSKNNNGTYESHHVGLSPNEIELVQEAQSTSTMPANQAL